MREKKPRPLAFCFLKGVELDRKNIDYWGCRDPEKQIYGICQHYKHYGDKKETLDKVKMQQIYTRIINDLALQGVRIEGRNINLVQTIPGGVNVKLSFDEAENFRRAKIAANRKCI